MSIFFALGYEAPPTGTITAPTGGATMSGDYTLQVSASDPRGIAGVQWKIDGANIGAEVTGGGSFGQVFDTRPYSDAGHTITAVIRSKTGKTTTLNVSANINNVPAGGYVFQNLEWPPDPTYGRHDIGLSEQYWTPGYSTPAAQIGNYRIRFLFYTSGGGDSTIEGGPSPDTHYARCYVNGTAVGTLYADFEFGDALGAAWYGPTTLQGAILIGEWYTNNAHAARTQHMYLAYDYVRFQ